MMIMVLNNKNRVKINTRRIVAAVAIIGFSISVSQRFQGRINRPMTIKASMKKRVIVMMRNLNNNSITTLIG
jgi:hypothetical protein